MGGSPLPKEINIGEPAKEPTVETMEAVGTVGGGLNRHGLPGGLPYRYDFDSKGCRELSREAKSCYLEGWKAFATSHGRRTARQVPSPISPFPRDAWASSRWGGPSTLLILQLHFHLRKSAPSADDLFFEVP